jgi:hypothetical protein
MHGDLMQIRWHKTDIRLAPSNVRFWGKADITATEWNFNLRLPQKLRQLGDIGRDAPRFVAHEQVRSADRRLEFSY